MQRISHLLSGTWVFGALALCPPAHAWEFRARFVERIGTLDIPLPADSLNAFDTPHRIRVQFGVFDDPTSPAPAGGFVGWNVGSIAVSGAPNNSAERRTPGRLSPFNFSAQPHANGNPPPTGGLNSGDPPGYDFQQITELDATLGTQSPPWLCGPDGQPLPMPGPFIRGLNTFVSVYEISIDPAASATNYSITYSGNLIAAIEWRVVGSPPPPPDCGDPNDPGGPLPGSITYAPLTAPPQPFSATLQVVVPSPAAAPVLLTFLAFAYPRRRS